MKFWKIITIIILFSLSSCGVPQSDYNKIVQENKKLKSELDECRNGAKKVIAQIEKSFSEKKYAITKNWIELLYEKHPERSENIKYKKLLQDINEKLVEEKTKKEQAEKERLRLENLNNTGMWEIRYYVDEFKEPTKTRYITNSNYIKGSFSNTATQNSKLNVEFLISDDSHISIQLYEYAGRNPVKAYSYENYNVILQDKNGNRMDLKAVNRSDRLSFDVWYSYSIHKILIKGGTIKFKIIEKDNPSTNYLFVIQNADWYENAYRLLTETKTSTKDPLTWERVGVR